MQPGSRLDAVLRAGLEHQQCIGAKQDPDQPGTRSFKILIQHGVWTPEFQESVTSNGKLPPSAFETLLGHQAIARRRLESDSFVQIFFVFFVTDSPEEDAARENGKVAGESFEDALQKQLEQQQQKLVLSNLFEEANRCYPRNSAFGKAISVFVTADQYVPTLYTGIDSWLRNDEDSGAFHIIRTTMKQMFEQKYTNFTAQAERLGKFEDRRDLWDKTLLRTQDAGLNVRVSFARFTITFHRRPRKRRQDQVREEN